MRRTLYDYCMERGDETLLKEWDSEKNGSLQPKEISYGSKRRVHWRCSKGHEWQAPVYTRTGGSGCPYCAGRVKVKFSGRCQEIADDVSRCGSSAPGG